MDRGGKVREFKRGSNLPKFTAQATCLQQQVDNSTNVHFRVAAGGGARRYHHVNAGKVTNLIGFSPNLSGKSLQDPKPTKLKLRGRTQYKPVVCFPMKELLPKLQTFEKA